VCVILMFMAYWRGSACATGCGLLSTSGSFWAFDHRLSIFDGLLVMGGNAIADFAWTAAHWFSVIPLVVWEFCSGMEARDFRYEAQIGYPNAPFSMGLFLFSHRVFLWSATVDRWHGSGSVEATARVASNRSLITVAASVSRVRLSLGRPITYGTTNNKKNTSFGGIYTGSLTLATPMT
jgi:hypothetical protein